MRDAGVQMAVASDCNPWLVAMTSLLLAMNMAATLFGMTPTETLRGVTTNAARALGEAKIGRIEAGWRRGPHRLGCHRPGGADLSHWRRPAFMRIFGGQTC